MISTLNLFRSLVIASAMSAAAYATNFNLNSLTPTGPITGNTPAADYKYGVNPAGETGVSCLVDDLTTTVTGLTATIEWGTAGAVDLDTIFLKAGNQYVYWDVSAIDWTAYTGFYVTNDWIRNPNGRTHPLLGISHVSLDGNCRSVPDAGATVLMLALGLSGAIGLRRRLSCR